MTDDQTNEAEQHTQAALFESEDRYRVLFDTSFDAIVLYQAGEILEVNPNFLALFGYERHEVIGQKYILPEVEKQVHSDSEAIFRRKDGTYFVAEVRATTTTYQGRSVKLALLRDVTAAKEAASRDQYLATVLEHVSDAIISTDPDLRIRSWNKGAERLYGWHGEEVIGQVFSQVVRTDYPNCSRETSLKELTSKGYWQGEVIQYHRDDTPLHVLNSTILMNDDAGRMKGIVAANRDISKRKIAEERLKRVAEVTSSFAAAQTLAEVRRIILEEVLKALESNGGGLRLVTEEGLVLEEHVRGSHTSEEILRHYSYIPLAAQHPSAEVVRSGQALFFRSPQEIIEHYPTFADILTQLMIQSNAHLPLKRGEETFGVLTLSFPDERLWDEDERRFALALADRTAIAYERARLFEKLREGEGQLRLVTDGMPALVSYLDSDYRYKFANKTYKEWFGLEHTDILGKTMTEVLGEAAFERIRPYAEEALAGKTQTFELEVPYKSGGTRFVLIVYTPDLQGDTVNGFFAHVLDITERKVLEERLRQAALYDALTGLPSRTLLMERLALAIARHKRDAHTTFALLFIDLDNFKTVNDSFGHAAGDGVLIEVATRLKGNLRETDTAARLGGDEFLVLLEGLESEEVAWQFAKRISRKLNITWGKGNRAVAVRASIGLAHHDGSSASPQELLSRADQAMYQAKQSGKGKVMVDGKT